MPATVTVYRGHRRTLFFPVRDYLPVYMCVGIIRNNSLVVGRARTESNPGHCTRDALLHMAAECVNHSATEAGPPEGYGQLKFLTFKNPRWRTAAILKSRKMPYLCNGLTDLHKIWRGDTYWPYKGYGRLTFNFKTFIVGLVCCPRLPCFV